MFFINEMDRKMQEGIRKERKGTKFLSCLFGRLIRNKTEIHYLCLELTL